MTDHLVTHGRMGAVDKATGIRASDIPERTEAVLKDWYRSSDHSENGEAGEAMAVLHAKGLWIACNCHPANVPAAILVPVMHDRHQGKMTVRRQVDGDDDRPDHHPLCPFYFDLNRRETLEREQRQRQLRKAPAEGRIWAIPAAPLASATAILREDRAARDPGPSGSRQSAIAGELWRIMWAGRCEYLEKAVGSSMSLEMAKVQNGISHIRHGIFGSLAEIATTYPRDIRETGRAWFRRVSAIDSWPPSVKPTAYLCALADSVEGGVAQTPGLGPIPVANGIRQPSLNGRPISGPYLVLIACEITPDGAIPHVGYAQPIVSRDCFAPVDSAFERTACQGIIDALGAIASRDPAHGIRVRKSAISRETDLGLCKPDFVCQVPRAGGGSARFVIEAMGLEDAAYVESKRSTHPRMEEVGPIEEIRYADKPSRAWISAWFRDLVAKHSA